MADPTTLRDEDPEDGVDIPPDVDKDRGGTLPTEDKQWEGTPKGDDTPRPSEDGDADADIDERDAGADHDTN